MSDIHFECSKCNQPIDAPKEMASQLIECPTCKETIEVPVRSQQVDEPKLPAPSKPAPAQATPPPSAKPSPTKFPAIQTIISNQGNVIIGLLILGTIIFPLLHTFYRAFFPQRWEYAVVAVSDYSFTEDMNKIGSQGWEVVSARRAAGQYETAKYEMIFKRPK